MARFRKEALYAGTWTLPGERKVRYGRKEIAHLARRANDMVAAGLSIPVCWNHQDVTPVSHSERLAQRERNTLGWLEAADAPGPLAVTIEIPDDEDARRIPAVRFASPEIQTDFVDGTGRLWPGKSITHLAVTARPVQTGQRPFERLSLNELNRRPERLSLEGYQMADEMETPEGGAGGELIDLIAALREAGMNVPDEVTDIPGLIIAVKAGKPGEAEPPPEDEAPADEAGTPVEGAEAASAPVLMSLDAARNPAAARVIELERADVGRRIESLRSVTRPVKDRLRKRLTAERLSLDGSARLAKCDLLVELAAYEGLDPLPIHAQAGAAERMALGGVTELPNPAAAAAGAAEDEMRREITRAAASVSTK